MTKTLERSSKRRSKGYTVGRRGFAKISAIEGIRLSPDMEARFGEFEREGLSAAERRQVLARMFGKAR